MNGIIQHSTFLALLIILSCSNKQKPSQSPFVTIGPAIISHAANPANFSISDSPEMTIAIFDSLIEIEINGVLIISSNVIFTKKTNDYLSYLPSGSSIGIVHDKSLNDSICYYNKSAILNTNGLPASDVEFSDSVYLLDSIISGPFVVNKSSKGHTIDYSKISKRCFYLIYYISYRAIQLRGLHDVLAISKEFLLSDNQQKLHWKAKLKVASHIPYDCIVDIMDALRNAEILDISLIKIKEK